MKTEVFAFGLENGLVKLVMGDGHTVELPLELVLESRNLYNALSALMGHVNMRLPFTPKSIQVALDDAATVMARARGES